MSDGTSLEALQWRQMIQRVFGEELTPIAAEGRIEQLKAHAAAAPSGDWDGCLICGRYVLAPGGDLRAGETVEHCDRCQRGVMPLRTNHALPDRTR